MPSTQTPEVVMQFALCHPEPPAFGGKRLSCVAEAPSEDEGEVEGDLGAQCANASRSLRGTKRALGAHPYLGKLPRRLP